MLYEEYMKIMVFAVALAVVPGVWPCAAATCIYDSVPLDGAWEMAYRSNAWDSAECPQFKGVVVDRAVPGNWEDMVPRFREAGMRDEFKPNPHYVRQRHPIGSWAKDMTVPGISGCFIYRRTVRLDRAESACLAFDCVRNKVRVWVNGKFAAAHDGFSTPFELPVPDGLLRRGDNEIVLSVSNDPCIGYNGREVSGLTTRALFASTGGIEGKVELRFPKGGLADVYVTTASDLKSFTVHVVGTGNGERFEWEILDGGKVLKFGEAKGDFTLSTKGFSLWSPENPKRYELVLKTAGGEYRQKFGVRRLVADGESLRLNGSPTYLRGVTEHCYFPKTVHMPRELGFYLEETRVRKELGFNFLRFHTFVPPEEYLDATDELGMLVHVESPNFVTLDEYRAIVAFARRHPSVVIYCTGNETMIDDRAEKYLKAVADIVHGGTDALFTPMSAMRGVEYMLGKGKTAAEPFKHNPERMKRLAAFSDFFTSYQLGATSYHSLNGATAAEVDRWGDAYCGKPRVSHEICIDGSFADISLERDYPPGSPIVESGVFSEIRGQLTAKGLLDRAGTYAVNSAEWMRRIRKFTFEKVRSMKRTAGYDFLGDINMHWHTFGYFVGMMDEFYRLKPGETVRNVLRYNSAAVLLSDLGSDFNVTAGEKKKVKFSISNFAGDAKDAMLKVMLVVCQDGNDSRVEAQRRGNGVECVYKVEKKVGEVKNGDVAALGEFEVSFPASDVPRKYLLRASFAGGNVSAENEWEMYAFPQGWSRFVADSDGAKPVSPVRIVADISKDDLLAAMSRGERVLLLGTGPFKSRKTSYRIGLAGRPNGNYATVIKPGHPALAGLPHDGYCGWQFRRLMEDGAAVQLEAGIPFDPIVEVVLSDKFLVRQAALFEYRIGEGRLIVCSFRFGDGDPAAAWLKGRLAEYAASNVFNPAQSLTPEQLRAVIDAPLVSIEKNRNSAANPNDPTAGLGSLGSAIGAELAKRSLPEGAKMSSYNAVFAEVAAADKACDAAWRECATKEELFRRGRKMREDFIRTVGGFPAERCPLNAQTVATVKRGGYVVEKVLFESWPGVHVPALLFLPDDPQYKPPYPAILLTCGHAINGKGSDKYQRGAVLAAKNGMACLVYDPFDQGERMQGISGNVHAHNRAGALAALLGGSMARFRIWDGMRALDYLESRPEVDASRLGVMGNSGGGTMTSLLMAVEPRLKAACPSCYISTYAASAENIGPGDAEQNVFGQFPLGVNNASFALMQFPLPIRFQFSHDDYFPFKGSLSTYGVVCDVAAKFGIENRYGMTDVDGPHGWKESARVSSIEWMRRWLCGDKEAFRHDLEGYRALDKAFDEKQCDMGLENGEELCCPGGKVRNIPSERTIYDLLREEYAVALTAREANATADDVRQLAGIKDPGAEKVERKELSRKTLDCGVTVTRTSYTWPGGIEVPVVEFVPSRIGGGNPLLAIGDDGKGGRVAAVRKALDEGRAVAVADLAGMGEVSGYRHRFYKAKENEEGIAVLLYTLGKSLVGIQAGEILEIAKDMKTKCGGPVEVAAFGRVSIAAAHARFVRPDLVSSAHFVAPPPSWDESVKSARRVPFANVVNGALRLYDWTDLAKVQKVPVSEGRKETQSRR